MKKLFLIPLVALFACVNAWASEIVVNDFATLKTQLSASGTADVVKLGQDITYGSEALNIERSLTLDGQGHQIIGSVACELSITTPSLTFVRNTIIAVNRGNVGSNLDVKVKNLYLQHSTTNRREICFVIFDGVSKFALDAVETEGHTTNNKDYDMQALLITGADATPLNLEITNSTIKNKALYPAYILKPINATLSNSTISGYCGLYFKYRWSDGGSGGYGNTVGSRGSVVNADACAFDCPNVTNGASNNFAIFPLEDDGITLNLNNCSFNASTLGNAYQRFVNLQYWERGGATYTAEDVNINITGDNTHLYNVTADKVAFNAWSMMQESPSTSEGNNDTKVTVDLNFNITGGTFTFHPNAAHWVLASDNITRQDNYVGGSGAITIPSTHEVQQANQGGKTVYRVVKKAQEKTPGVMYNLNDLVTGEGIDEGNNPVSSFDLSDGSDMTLNNEVTTAGYVQVKDNGSDATTVTVGQTAGGEDQTLKINNGLDVQGESQVIVEPGSALIIGEGGIVTSKPENIVIEADEEGAATLLLEPTIKVNQTPELTVKMLAKGVGRIGDDYFWHRFALPVDHVAAGDGSWAKDGHSYGTLLYRWDYVNNKWTSLSSLEEMQPFYGYTMSLEETVADPAALKDAGYIFKGKLTGNVNSTLDFSRQGYNYFGNSYTGYISVLKLVDQLLGNGDLDGTVWMWNTEEQQFEDVPLNDLKNNPTAARFNGSNSWKKEVAPMQTFILRLMSENTDATAEINYANAVWGNPRYDAVTGQNNAPARRVESTNDAYVRIVIAAANGKKDAVKFYEDANLSDAYDKGFDGAKYMNENSINVYATVNGENYGTVATDNIEGMSFAIRTNNEIAYTMTFTDVEGNEYAIRDNVTNQVIAIEEGAIYEFTAQSNSVVEGRFEIVSVAEVATAIENTEVKANVKGIYTIMGQYLGENFDILPAGVYVVNGVKIVK